MSRELTLFCLCSAFAFAGCEGTARVFPINEIAIQAGTPTITYIRQGTQHGPVKVTMPNGEVMIGEFQVTENAAIGFGFAGGQFASAVGFGSGSRLVVAAQSAQGQIINCEGLVDIGGHGSIVCETNAGARYRVMI